MTEQEWTIVATAFTDLFDIVKNAAPEKINVNKMFTAGTILNQELERLRARRLFFNEMTNVNSTGMRSPGIHSGRDWMKRNEELEKKKEAQHAQDAEDLAQTLRRSVEKVKKDRQETQGE